MKAPGIVQLNAGKHIQHAAYVCQNKKENMPRSSSNSSHQNFILCRTANVLRASFLLRQLLYNNNFNLLRYDATQRCEAVICVTCIVCML